MSGCTWWEYAEIFSHMWNPLHFAGPSLSVTLGNVRPLQRICPQYVHPEEVNHCLISHRLVKLTLVSPPISLLMHSSKAPIKLFRNRKFCVVLWKLQSQLETCPCLPQVLRCMLSSQPAIKGPYLLTHTRVCPGFCYLKPRSSSGIFCLLFLAQASGNGSLIYFPEVKKKTW